MLAQNHMKQNLFTLILDVTHELKNFTTNNYFLLGCITKFRLWANLKLGPKFV